MEELYVVHFFSAVHSVGGNTVIALRCGPKEPRPSERGFLLPDKLSHSLIAMKMRFDDRNWKGNEVDAVWCKRELFLKFHISRQNHRWRADRGILRKYPEQYLKSYKVTVKGTKKMSIPVIKDTGNTAMRWVGVLGGLEYDDFGLCGIFFL